VCKYFQTISKRDTRDLMCIKIPSHLHFIILYVFSRAYFDSLQPPPLILSSLKHTHTRTNQVFLMVRKTHTPELCANELLKNVYTRILYYITTQFFCLTQKYHIKRTRQRGRNFESYKKTRLVRSLETVTR